MQYWDVKETAGRTRTSEALWRKFIRLRQIPVVKIGRLVRLDPEAVRKFLEERTRPAKEDLSK